MKESRLITIFSLILALVTTFIAIILYYIWPNLIDYVGILTNIYCGIIVGLVTSLCQYFVQKRKIISNVYVFIAHTIIQKIDHFYFIIMQLIFIKN